MNDQKTTDIHWSFWVIGIIGLLWNVMGGINFFMQMNPEALASFPETHRAIIDSRPTWATIGFAVAVFGGVLGCLLLLLRKPIASCVLIASLLGVIVTMIHAFGVTRSNSDFTPFEIIMMMVMPVVVAIFLVWYEKVAERRGWIRKQQTIGNAA